jgi:hypothetical protein
MSVSEYRENIRTRDGKDLAGVYIAGMGEGYTWANAALESRGDKALYCFPPHLAVNGVFYTNVLEGEMKQESERMT